MTFAAVSWAWRQSPGSAAAKMLLLYLADGADHNGLCCPSIDRLAEQTQVKACESPAYLDALQSDGLIYIHWPERVGARKKFVVLSDDISRAYARSLGM